MLFVLCLCWLGHLVVSNELSIAAFNVKTFGQTKLGKEDVMELLNKVFVTEYTYIPLVYLYRLLQFKHYYIKI